MYLTPLNDLSLHHSGFDYHFARAFPLALSTLFDHEFDSFSRRFKVTERGEGFELVLDLPGFKSSDLDVELEKSILTVRAKNESDEVENSITVGQDIDPEKVDAVLENGRLVITLSKRESAKPRKVVVK